MPFSIGLEKGKHFPVRLTMNLQVNEPPLQSMKFLKLLRKLHPLNRMDLIRIKVNSFGCDHEFKEFSTRYPKNDFVEFIFNQ